jgi:hypothetical protein
MTPQELSILIVAGFDYHNPFSLSVSDRGHIMITHYGQQRNEQSTMGAQEDVGARAATRDVAVEHSRLDTRGKIYGLDVLTRQLIFVV